MIPLRIRKQKEVAAQRIAQQLIAHQTIEAVDPLRKSVAPVAT
jgi:hypothetical protein